jgi:FkbM family methyltransferase
VLELPVKAWHRVRSELGFPADRIDAAMHRFGAAFPDASFVQVGANDGVSRDPLRMQISRRRWSGVMVEPVPSVFARLEQRYGDHPRIRLENSAITSSAGVLPFFALREPAPGEDVWPLYHTLGSFQRDVILSHKEFIPDIEDRLVETDVPCMTFEHLCEKHGLDRLDVLLIDTEGHDWTVLQTVDLARRQPGLIVYEHCHLPAEDAQAARAHLSEHGYVTFEHGLDTAALDAGIDDRALQDFFARQPGSRPPAG